MSHHVERLKVGLIGLGNMGKNHLRVLSLLKRVDISIICDKNEKTVHELSNKYELKGTSSVDDIFKEDINTVVICSPTSLHAEHIKMAINNGIKHVFVEKPLTATLEEAKEIEVLAEKNDVHLQIGFIERFNPAIMQLQKVLESSNRVINVDFTRTNKISSRITDVDVISDLMVHDIDLAIMLNGPVKDVSAHGALENGLVAYSSVLLSHENKRFSRLQASRVTEKKIRRVEATCDNIFVDCELLSKVVVIHRQSEISTNQQNNLTIKSLQEHVEVKPQEALLSELEIFAAHCLGEKLDKKAPNISEGIQSMVICDKIQKEVKKCH